MAKIKQSVTQALIVVLLVCLGSFNAYQYFTKPKLVYVRSHDLIEKYQGTVEARAEFESKKNRMTLNVDSLKIDFERAKNQYVGEMNKLSPSQRHEREGQLSQQQNQLIQYSQAINDKIGEEDSKMMQEVLNQINAFVEGYAIEKNYSVVLGTTLSGNILYGKKDLDITDQLIVYVNNQYKGKK